MKIVLITATYAPSTNGVAISVAGLKKSLEEKGHEVYLFAPENKKKLHKKEKNVFRYPSMENPIHKDYPIPLLPINGLIIKKLRKIKPDIVHVHHAYYIGYFAKILADYYKVPLVFTYHTNHDYYAKKYVGFLPKALRDTFLNNGVYEFCKKADLVISPAEHTTKKLLKKAEGINVVTIPTPVSLISPKLGKQLLRKNYGFAKEKVMLSVTRLSKEKNVELLIKSVKYLPKEYILLIAGTGPDEEKLKVLAKKLKVDGRIKFLGRVVHDAISTFYAMSDVFLFASDSETQGLVYLEAINFNKPIVTVRSQAAAEYIKVENGLMVEKSPKKFALAVQKIETLDYKKMANLNKKIRSGFNPKNITQKLETEYAKLIMLNKKIKQKNIVAKISEAFSPNNE